MPNRRIKKHSKYFKVSGYQMISGKTDAEMAELLGCCARTYREKINGWSDFTPLEARTLASFFDRPQSVLFFTEDVPKSTH